MNTRMFQMLHLPPEQASQLRSRADLVSAFLERIGNAGSHNQLWLRSSGVQAAIRDEIRIEHPVERLLERIAHPLTDERGALLGRVEVYRDLSDQRLFQSKLLQTGRLAELGQRLTAVAHELSNPLTSILGYAQRLAQRAGASNGSREARQIFQEAERASEILRQLLLAARESRPQRRRISLNGLVTRAVELHDTHLTTEKVRIELDLDPALPLVHGDRGQLQQVLQNLIGNARQALVDNHQQAAIRVSTRRVSGNRVLLEVADNGSGIPASIQNRIFDPFFTTKPAGVGTGLGLSIVASIVREHGGEVRVSSMPGEGSVFSVELPAAATLEIEPGRAAKGGAVEEPIQFADGAAGLSAKPGGLNRWAGVRVLVLEDEPTVAHLIADVLEDEGLGVDTVVDGQEALSRMNEDYALVICDMRMPQLDGEEFYRALLRERSPLRERLLFVTGDVLSPRTRNFLESHQLPYVAKPFRVDELTEKIQGVLEQAEGNPLGAAKQNAATNNRG
jgi:signal transduction histidine kinase/ActR/RegA family two-component response regulator